MPQLRTIADVVNQAALEMGITQFPAAAVVVTADQDISQLRSLASAVADEVLLEEPYRRTLGDGMWLVGVDGQTKTVAEFDTDIVLFDSRLMVDGLKFRFLQAKGLEFGEPLRDFAQRLNRLAGRINGKILDLDMDGDRAV